MRHALSHVYLHFSRLSLLNVFHVFSYVGAPRAIYRHSWVQCILSVPLPQLKSRLQVDCDATVAEWATFVSPPFY